MGQSRNSILRTKTMSIYENGNLVISIKEEQTLWDSIWGNRKITSGRIHSQDKLEFTYGRVEARIQIPILANGLWPCLWMLGSNFDDVGWPASGSMTLMQMGSAEAISAKSSFHQRRFGAILAGRWRDCYSRAIVSIHRFDLTVIFILTSWNGHPRALQRRSMVCKLLRKDISEEGCPACDEFHKSHFFILNVAVGWIVHEFISRMGNYSTAACRNAESIIYESMTMDLRN